MPIYHPITVIRLRVSIKCQYAIVSNLVSKRIFEYLPMMT